jgi:hypothetical protein
MNAGPPQNRSRTSIPLIYHTGTTLPATLNRQGSSLLNYIFFGTGRRHAQAVQQK